MLERKTKHPEFKIFSGLQKLFQLDRITHTQTHKWALAKQHQQQQQQNRTVAVSFHTHTHTLFDRVAAAACKMVIDRFLHGVRLLSVSNAFIVTLCSTS